MLYWKNVIYFNSKNGNVNKNYKAIPLQILSNSQEGKHLSLLVLENIRTNEFSHSPPEGTRIKIGKKYHWGFNK